MEFSYSKVEIPLMNNAIDDRHINQEQIPRHSPTGIKNKRLLTKDIMSGRVIFYSKSFIDKSFFFSEAEYLLKHLHLSHEIDYDLSSPTTGRKSLISEDYPIPENLSSINERLYMNFTETCPLFLLKEGIDHRFEFLDFSPDFYIRQKFHPINPSEFSDNISEKFHQTTIEIE